VKRYFNIGLWVGCGLLALAGRPALAVDLNGSGFGTLGYAQSNRSYTYQRFIDDAGTFQRDTLLAGQLDAQFDPHWSATVQVTLAPSSKHDAGWAITPSWVFVGWRPTNDWLVRVGRLRVPLYLHSETLDVGNSHDLARQPAEMYSILPKNDFDGVLLGKSWDVGEEGEFTAEAYHGKADVHARIWYSDGVPPLLAAGVSFDSERTRSTGLVFTLRQPDLLLRGGLHRAVTRRTNGEGFPATYPYVPLAPGMGYYQVSNDLPGPGVTMTRGVVNYFFTLGAEYEAGGGWRWAAEFARNVQRKTDQGMDTRGGYLALFKRIEDVTPYVSLAALRSSAGALAWVDRLTGQPLPGAIPGADALNAAQRAAAEGAYTVDQRSLAVGSAYALSASSKLKVEWMRTHIGRVSKMVDTPAGSAAPRDTHVDVVSLSYSFVF
jgi:hypothetical protein